MKRSLIAAAALALVCTLAPAQSRQYPEPARLLRENPRRAGCVTDPYEYGPVEDTPAPKGYKPFYISHYGRHGSRSDWHAENYSDVVAVLQKAKEAGILTPSGDSLMTEAARVFALHNGMDGRLTDRGVREHRAIAERMYRRFKPVFTKGPGRIRAVSSLSQRCIISMTSFSSRLSALQPGLNFTWDTGDKFMPMLSSDGPGPVNERVYPRLDSLKATYSLDTLGLIQRLFTDPEKARSVVGDQRKFAYQVFRTAAISASFDLEPSIYRFMPFDLVYDEWDLTNADLYLRQGNSRDYGALRMPLAFPLVRDVIAKADEAIAGGAYAADLRFGHDTHLLATAACMGLEGVGEQLSLEEARARWMAFRYAPFAANLQWVFYRKRSGGDILVKILHNEREVGIIGLEPVAGPYYRWQDVKARWEAVCR